MCDHEAYERSVAPARAAFHAAKARARTIYVKEIETSPSTAFKNYCKTMKPIDDAYSKAINDAADRFLE